MVTMVTSLHVNGLRKIAPLPMSSVPHIITAIYVLFTAITTRRQRALNKYSYSGQLLVHGPVVDEDSSGNDTTDTRASNEDYLKASENFTITGWLAQILMIFAQAPEIIGMDIESRTC